MNKPAKAEPERIPLPVFLARLSNEEAGHARVAAETMDDLEARTYHLRGIEQRLAPYFYVACIAFVLGLLIFIIGNDFFFGLFSWVDNLGVTILLSGLPVLGFCYAFRVRSRTHADARAFELNQKHFMPHSAIYFPAGGPAEQSWVILIDQDAGYKPKPSKYDHVKPGGLLW
ncbi:MAG: hypothetical protein AAGB04_12405 [Pseudomonadota bacterium]